MQNNISILVLKSVTHKKTAWFNCFIWLILHWFCTRKHLCQTFSNFHPKSVDIIEIKQSLTKSMSCETLFDVCFQRNQLWGEVFKINRNLLLMKGTWKHKYYAVGGLMYVRDSIGLMICYFPRRGWHCLSFKESIWDHTDTAYLILACPVTLCPELRSKLWQSPALFLMGAWELNIAWKFGRSTFHLVWSGATTFSFQDALQSGLWSSITKSC